jgi:predicted AAA+ superfamily ATPase
MKQFRDQNPGLKSRIGFELDFPDYSVDELVEILRKKVKDRDLEIDEDAVEKARKVIARAREVENFGNGRYIDQFVQKIVINHAIRLQNEEDLDKLRRLTKDDIIDLKAETSRNRIGFNMN